MRTCVVQDQALKNAYLSTLVLHILIVSAGTPPDVGYSVGLNTATIQTDQVNGKTSKVVPDRFLRQMCVTFHSETGTVPTAPHRSPHMLAT